MNKHRTSADVRREFIEFFEKRCAHTFIRSSPCVPIDDPTLMFTNAGMNQFKPIFLGTVDRNTDFGRLKRAANTQKCIRAGGKHNDLDDVGHDTYHHTFFEMLGNWSFGDYFKKEAIEWAWELLTGVWGIDPTRLHATYFEGDAAENLAADTEARDFWLRILPPERVHPGNKKDNFWEMGDTGPCGPCSEIHIDLTPGKIGGKLVNAGDARVMEIWNLVFIQFNRGADGKLTPLPAKHVDTGMGFERICSVVIGQQQGKLGKVSNYDTDAFTPIFAAIRHVTGADAYTGLLEDESKGQPTPEVMRDIAYRVVADHIRTLTFALTDGATPSNEGRGYVLRRILRRAVRYGRQYLGTREPFLCKLVPAVANAMGEAFPELKSAHRGQNVEHVAMIIRGEEESFIKTLDRGIALFDEAAQVATKNHHGRISGEDAFKLHDTYGFPIDLTELMAEERGLTVNIGRYERLMEEAREKARTGGKSGEVSIKAIPPAIQAGLSSTDDHSKYVASHLEAMATAVLRIGSEAGLEQVLPDHSLFENQHGVLVLDQTCFYAEQGGQVGDRGTIRTDKVESEAQDIFDVDDTIRVGDLILHVGRVRRGAFGHGEPVFLEVGPERRHTMKNHTVTHVMNWALREVLGEHVQQKGSLVDPEKTRFDLSHHAQITDEELTRIEHLTNEQIGRDLPVYAKEVPQKDALKIHGLRAVFGEKYPDVVRVVSIGAEIGDVGKSDANTLLGDPSNAKWQGYSVEFCGGTHVKKTGEIGKFRLIEESAVAKGVRRVTGITAERAEAAEKAAADLACRIAEAATGKIDNLVEHVGELTAALSTTELPVVDKNRLRTQLAELQERVKQQKKADAKAGAADAASRAEALLAAAPTVGATRVIVGEMAGASVDQLRAAADSLRSKAGSAAVLLAAENDGKVVLLAAMTPDVIQRGLKAGDVIKEIAPVVGGKGGGRPDMAQGGGTDPTKIGEAVQRAKDWLQSKLN